MVEKYVDIINYKNKNTKIHDMALAVLLSNLASIKSKEYQRT